MVKSDSIFYCIRMNEIKKLIDDMGITSFENNMKVAGLAVLSDSRDIIYQTENWDLSGYQDIFFGAFKGANSIEFNNLEFLVEMVSEDTMIGANSQGMGYILGVSFKGGILLCYALPGGDPNSILAFLKSYTIPLQNLLK